MSDPPTTDPTTTDPDVPQEQFLIVYWDVRDQRWMLSGGWADEAEARRWLTIARQELGQRRVRMLHTADVAT